MLASLVSILLFSARADAGIYNMQSILATEADEGLSGAISGSVDWRTGNVDYLFLSTTPLARYRNGKHLFIGVVRADHKTSRGTIILSNTFEHLRYRYEISDMVLGEAFVQHQFDDVRRLQVRGLVGAGPMFELLDAKKYGIDLGIAYMLEYEKLRVDDELDSGATDLAHRNSTYLVGHYQLDERVQVVESMYYQPKLTDPSDFRILNDTQLSFKVTERLSFTNSFTIAYDSHPPLTIKRLDTTLLSSLTLEL